jgi:sensor histidine kinase YesM
MEKKDYSRKVPFLEEMDYIETYLKLEQLRFEDRIQVIFDIQIHDFWILPLSIQPFVENAVKHGLLAKKEGGHIWITTKELEKEIQIIVQDDGVGFDTKAFWKEIGEIKSIGLKSSLFRLENDMNAVCKMESSMEPENSGTYIEIRIPKKEVTKDENNNRRR